MSIASLQNRLAKLGFGQIVPVSTLRSIAQLFGLSKPRCGIYLLAFPEDRFYIGQAVEVVRRFAQHRNTYDEIIGFAFIPTSRTLLDAVERDLIQKAERAGIVLLNTVHASNVVGESDLDLVISAEEPAVWSASPAAFNTKECLNPIQMHAAQLDRFHGQFTKFQAHPLYQSALTMLQTYTQHCILAPQRTEYSFWVVSCMPSTNRNTWPRLFCISAGVMELMVVGFHKNEPSKMWGFVVAAADVLYEALGGKQGLLEAFPGIEVVDSHYRDAGQHQVTLFGEDERTLTALVKSQHVQRAAATLALRVMRKRATIYSKFHCKQLADLATAAPGEVIPEAVV